MFSDVCGGTLYNLLHFGVVDVFDNNGGVKAFVVERRVDKISAHVLIFMFNSFQENRGEFVWLD